MDHENDFDPEFFRDVRLAAGVPMPVIAAALGVSRQAAYYWQAGLKRPSPEHARALALLCHELAEHVAVIFPSEAAAISLVTQAQSAPASLGIQLLADLRDLRTQRAGEPWVATEVLLEYLVSLDEAPWGDLRGVPIDARRLARLLAPYGARPQARRVGTAVLRGYLWADLEDAFEMRTVRNTTHSFERQVRK